MGGTAVPPEELVVATPLGLDGDAGPTLRGVVAVELALGGAVAVELALGGAVAVELALGGAVADACAGRAVAVELAWEGRIARSERRVRPVRSDGFLRAPAV